MSDTQTVVAGKRAAGLAWGIPIVMFVVIRVVMIFSDVGRGDSGAESVVMGLFWVTVVTSLVAVGCGVKGLMGWRVSRDSRVLSGSLIGLGLCVLLVGGMVLGMQKSLARQEALNELRVTTTRNALTAMEQGGDSEEYLQDASVRYADVAAKVGGEEGLILGAASKLYDELQPTMVVYNESLSAFVQAGGLQASTLGDKKAIGERIRLLEAFAEANEETDRTMMGLEGKLVKLLKKEDLKDETIAGVVKGWRSGSHMDLLRKLRDTDRRLAARGVAMLTMLKAEWGNWEVVDGQVSFADELKTQQYAEWSAEVAKINDEQAGYQAEVAQRLRQRVPDEALPDDQ